MDILRKEGGRCEGWVKRKKYTSDLLQVWLYAFFVMRRGSTERGKKGRRIKKKKVGKHTSCHPKVSFCTCSHTT